MDKNEFNRLYHKIILALNECDNILSANETAEQAYSRGLDDAWALAKQLIRSTPPDVLRCMGFGDSICHKNLDEIILNNFTASEALAKIREYEERKKAEGEAIKVGDELVHRREPTVKAVATRISDDGNFSGVSNDGGQNNAGEVFSDRSPKDWRKTGRHFPQIAEVLGEIRDPDGKEDA